MTLTLGEQSVAKEVLAYFLRHPQAADVEDVARWRLQQETIHHTVEEVSAALTWLQEEKQFLLKAEAAGIRPMFKLNPERVAEAQRFVTDAPPSRPSVPMSPLMMHALAWIDAALLRHHRENPPVGDDLPGLTRSRASIEEALLPRRIAGADATEAHPTADESARELAAAIAGADPGEPLARLHSSLKLTLLELQALLLCLAPELDAKYHGVYGVLNDDLGRRTATLGLIGAVLGERLGIRSALAAAGGLTTWRLLQSGAVLPYADEPLRVDSTALGWILGDDAAFAADPRLAPVLSRRPWTGAAWMADAADAGTIGQLAGLFAWSTADASWIVLSGEDADGWRALTEAAAEAAAVPLLRISLAATAGIDAAEADEIAARLTRAARLTSAVPALDAGELKPETADAFRSLVGAFVGAGCGGVIVAPGVERIVGALPRERTVILSRALPGHAALAAAFMAAARDAGLDLAAEDADRLSVTFPLPLARIDEAVRLAVLESGPPDAITGGDSGARPAEELAAACRRIASPDLPRFARRVDPVFDLEDVILPPDRHAQLGEMVGHVRHASHVLNTWGFKAQLPYGRGVAALFCGPSGTGKTMAAHAIARELRTDTYVVDLSRVVSKYIGESEKNLDCVFNDAEKAGAVLLFDEADALFGKRSEIKDAHDRYANIEVAYLLQRIEAFSGLAILTTNFRQNLDQAFVRRLRFVIEFPRPDAAARETIWHQCLPSAAVACDIRVRALARRLELTGGDIRQITLRAAFLAAADRSTAIGMTHLLTATRAELLKLGMVGAERDLAELEAAQRPAPVQVA